MDKKIEFFTVREVVEKSLQGFSNFYPQYTYQTVFYNSTTDMSNAKMFVGVWFNGKFYELKITMKRDRVKFDSTISSTGDKGTLYAEFVAYINKALPIFKLVEANGKAYISDYMHDYELSFILKRDVKKG